MGRARGQRFRATRRAGTRARERCSLGPETGLSVSSPTVTTRTEAQGCGTPNDAESAHAAWDALAVSGVTGRGEPVGNGFGVGILRFALRILEQDGEAAEQQLRRLEDLLRRALAALEDRGGGR